MPPATPGQRALAAARLLGQLPGKDLTSAEAQTWLCQELAYLFGADSAALCWPAQGDGSPEVWSDGKSPGGSAALEQVRAEFSCQEVDPGRSVWAEFNSACGEPASRSAEAEPGWMAALPFPAGIREPARLLLWRPTLDLPGVTEDWLVALASGIAGQREQARQLRQSRGTCAGLERRRDELRRSRDTLRALFDNTPTAMYLVGPDYTLLAVNRCRANQTDQQPQRLVGRPCFEALFGRSDPCPGCLVRESQVERRRTRREASRSLGDGRTTILEVATFPVWQGAEKNGQAIVFEEDVTDRRRLEASLAQSERLAAIGRLAAGVAHEINNPLTAILANAQLLQRSLAGVDGDWLEMVDLVLEAGRRASLVVRQLLDLSRQGRTERLMCDVNESLGRAFTLIQHQLRVSAIRLLPELEKGLPMVWANPDELQSVWLNLLVNAIDAIEAQPGEIRVRTRRAGETIEVSVQDNGLGIPGDQLARVFEPFYTTKEPGTGTGLGLSICHRLVKDHGGQIQVESQPGQGTTFTISLPIPPPS
jgi:PAS domain S-box-containing protein